jgi:N6-adenosine-specific RNA methylase IME4
MSTRNRLPNRRPAESFELDVDGLRYTATVGRFSDGTFGELFLSSHTWGFTYKTQAVWVKNKSGLGLVFRNKHEVLLYGTRGKMPGPQYQPLSVFAFPRGRHSAKPPEIRAEIEKMYPDFDARTRLELFARETVAGCTPYGLESHNAAA